MSIQHSAIVDASRHENKGADAASNDTVATITSHATVWKKLTVANLDTAAFFRTNKFILSCRIDDVSTAGSVKLCVPVTATLTRVTSTLQGAIASVDSVLTVTNHSGGSAGTITVAFTSSAAGDVDQLSPVSNNTFTAGQIVTIATDGGSTNTVPVLLTLEFTQTA